MFSLVESARFLSDGSRPLGGKAVWKYLLRGALLFPWASTWARYLLQDDEARQMLALRPRLLLKLQRPYLRKSAGAGQRLEWLMDHYRWMRTVWPWAFTREMFRRNGVVLASVTGESGAEYCLVLQPTNKFDREGELLLTLELAGDALATLSFTVRRHAGAWATDIGCLQGPRPENGRDCRAAVRIATSDLHGLRPKQAVLLALYALARGYGVDRVLAVTNADHIHQARWRSRRRVAADYDGFWTEMGGQRTGDSFALPEGLARKCAADIPSRKRAQYRRRHGLEDALVAQIRAALPGCADIPAFATPA